MENKENKKKIASLHIAIVDIGFYTIKEIVQATIIKQYYPNTLNELQERYTQKVSDLRVKYNIDKMTIIDSKDENLTI